MPAKKTGYYTVYAATSPSGKTYVGFTHYRLEDRIWQHLSEARRGKKRPIYNAIRKYEKQITWNILGIYYTEAFAKNREKHFIREMNTIENGYNVTEGGEGTLGLIRKSQRKPLIDELGNIYSCFAEAAEQNNLELSTLKNAVRKGYWSGSKYFSFYKKGMSVAVKPKGKPKHKRMRKVEAIEIGMCFLSLRDTATYLNVTEQAIQRVVSGRRNTVKGCSLRYIQEG